MKLVLGILVLVVLGVVIFLFFQTRNASFPLASSNNEASWTFDGKSWQVRGAPPPCPDPLTLPSPVDINLVSGILYPGQDRGNDYKPHGAFRFDNRDTNDIEVRAIMDGYILKASRYEDFGGEIQNFMFYVNPCGIMIMHDHFLTPSPKLQEIFDKLPIGQNGDSRTTYIEPKVYVKKGEILATEIGYRNFPGGYKNKNIGVDFGLYDLRKTNGVNYDSSFRTKFPMIDEYGTHAVCWLDYLEEPGRSLVRSLPGVDGRSGASSDYCK